MSTANKVGGSAPEMNLITAIELVHQDPFFRGESGSIRGAVEATREVWDVEDAVFEDPNLTEAYRIVITADVADIETAYTLLATQRGIDIDHVDLDR